MIELWHNPPQLEGSRHDMDKDIERHKQMLRMGRRASISDEVIAKTLRWTDEYLRILQRELSVEDDDRAWHDQQ